MKNDNTNSTTTLPIHKVIKIASCSTLSGTSELSYYIGRDGEDKIFFLISNNTGGGYFNREWIAYKDVQAALTGRTISSIPLRQLFKGKSLNTSGFLLAVLIAEGLIERVSGKKNMYSLCPDESFLQAMSDLIAKEVDLTSEVIDNLQPKPSKPPVDPETPDTSNTRKKTTRRK